MAARTGMATPAFSSASPHEAAGRRGMDAFGRAAASVGRRLTALTRSGLAGAANPSHGGTHAYSATQVRLTGGPGTRLGTAGPRHRDVAAGGGTAQTPSTSRGAQRLPSRRRSTYRVREWLGDHSPMSVSHWPVVRGVTPSSFWAEVSGSIERPGMALIAW